MDFGIALAADVTADDLRAEAPLAERAGFRFLATGEHLFFKSPAPNALVTLAGAATLTSRIRLLTSVLLLPLYPAALAVKMIATLDRISSGRLDVGVGVGGEYPPEFEAVGVPMAERAPRTEEALTLLDLLWSGEEVTYHGRTGSVVDLALNPAPCGPRPPVWMGGRTGAAERRAARHADVWYPYMVTPDMFAAGLDRVRALAGEAGRDSAAIGGALFAWAFVGDDDAAARAAAARFVGDVYRQDFRRLADRYLVSGDPERVTARLREYADAGVDTVIFALACPREGRAAQIERLAAEVVPAAAGARGGTR